MNGSRGRIDWSEAHRRVQASLEAVERASEPDPSALDALFRRRAEALARRVAVGGTRRATRSALVFSLGGERFALELAALARVAPATGITPIPLPAAGVPGVTVRDGELVSVIDLARVLGLGPAERHEPAERGHLLFLRDDPSRSGLLVGGVDRIVDLAAEPLREEAASAAGPAGCLRGLTPEGVRVLDAALLLARPLLACAAQGVRARARAAPGGSDLLPSA